jgi:hypothetical protein
MTAAVFLILSGVYLLCGLIFAIPFVLVGVGKIDPAAAYGTWGFRLLIIPGSVLLWPLLAWRWLRGVHEPPDERNAHRLSAQRKVQNTECPKPDDFLKSPDPALQVSRSELRFALHSELRTPPPS